MLLFGNLSSEYKKERMRNFLNNLLNGNGVSPTDICLKSFTENFHQAVNVEWHNKKAHFEAIFYIDDREYIANFSLNGVLTEYRQNLPQEFLPVPIKNMFLDKGEIMNSVLKNKGNAIEYEIIFRDIDLNRHLLICSDTGHIIEETKL